MQNETGGSHTVRKGKRIKLQMERETERKTEGDPNIKDRTHRSSGRKIERERPRC
jgi:hypothetical protein